VAETQTHLLHKGSWVSERQREVKTQIWRLGLQVSGVVGVVGQNGLSLGHLWEWQSSKKENTVLGRNTFCAAPLPRTLTWVKSQEPSDRPELRDVLQESWPSLCKMSTPNRKSRLRRVPGPPSAMVSLEWGWDSGGDAGTGS
jgi:hypothetical protein